MPSLFEKLAFGGVAILCAITCVQSYFLFQAAILLQDVSKQKCSVDVAKPPANRAATSRVDPSPKEMPNFNIALAGLKSGRFKAEVLVSVFHRASAGEQQIMFRMVGDAVKAGEIDSSIMPKLFGIARP